MEKKQEREEGRKEKKRKEQVNENRKRRTAIKKGKERRKEEKGRRGVVQTYESPRKRGTPDTAGRHLTHRQTRQVTTSDTMIPGKTTPALAQ